MLIYPLSHGEDRTIRWATRIVAPAATVVILLLQAISIASAAG